jgi:hypothetical protein
MAVTAHQVVAVVEMVPLVVKVLMRHLEMMVAMVLAEAEVDTEQLEAHQQDQLEVLAVTVGIFLHG